MGARTSFSHLLTVRAFCRTHDSFHQFIRPPSVSFVQPVKLRVWCMVYGSWWDMKYGTLYKGILKLGWTCMSCFRRCVGFLCFVCTDPASIATERILFCCFSDTPQSIAFFCWFLTVFSPRSIEYSCFVAINGYFCKSPVQERPLYNYISLKGKGNVVLSSQLANSASIFLWRPSLYKGVTGYYYNDGFFKWQQGTHHNGTSIRPFGTSELLPIMEKDMKQNT